MSHNHCEGFTIYKYADGQAFAGPRDPEIADRSKREVVVSKHVYLVACDDGCTNLRASRVADVTVAESHEGAVRAAVAGGDVRGADPQALIGAAVAAVAAL
jgi:hypothetical protein